MKNDLIFVPIFKNKANAEPNAIEAVKPILNSNTIPYIELINDQYNEKLDEKGQKKENLGYKKTKNAIKDILHFEQFYRKKNVDIIDIISKTKANTNNKTISSIHILNNSEVDEHFDSIQKCIIELQQKGFKCALRVSTEISEQNIFKFISILEKGDFLFIDIADNDYKSIKLFLNKIDNYNRKCRIIIISDERPTNTTNKSLMMDDYNKSFNTSVINAIINNSFNQDGFASYCAAKNDLSQGGAYKYDVYGVFVIYEYSKNDFFSFKTDKVGHISTIYSSLKPKIKSNKSTISNLFKNTKISYDLLNSFLNNNKKGQAATYICFSIVHYIEEIINNLY